MLARAALGLFQCHSGPFALVRRIADRLSPCFPALMEEQPVDVVGNRGISDRNKPRVATLCPRRRGAGITDRLTSAGFYSVPTKPPIILKPLKRATSKHPTPGGQRMKHRLDCEFSGGLADQCQD